MTDPHDSATGSDRREQVHEPFGGLLNVVGYAVAPNAELYVAVMDAALDARDRFRLQLRPADIASAVGIDRDTASTALHQLFERGALHRTYDASEAETLAEFYKGAYLYQLTPAGIAAHRGIRDVLATRMATAGRLSASLLPRIHEALEAIIAGADDGDESRLSADFTALFSLVEELAESAATYLRELDAEVPDLAADSDRLAAYKSAVLTYLERFNRELNRWAPQVVDAIARLEPEAPALLARVAKLDAAPRPDGSYDDGPIDSLLGYWEGTIGWFYPRPGRPPTSDYVSAAMIAAINRVLGAISRSHEQRLRRVSREADFVQLATWFAHADDTEVHALWDETTGLWSARHFHDLAGDDSVDRRRSFWDAGSAELAPRLRTSTKRGSTGRPGKRADYSKAKRAARERALAAAEQAAAARARLSSRTPARLSDLQGLDADEFAALLDCLAAVLAEHPSGDHRVAVLPGVTIRLRPVADGAVTTVHTSNGTFSCPDDNLDIDVANTKAALLSREAAS